MAEAMCAHHETVPATAGCPACGLPVCAKCRAFGAGGACGMCVELGRAPSAPPRSPTRPLSLEGRGTGPLEFVPRRAPAPRPRRLLASPLWLLAPVALAIAVALGSKALFEPRPLSAAQEAAYLLGAMEAVAEAAVAIEEREGHFPDSREAILDEVRFIGRPLARPVQLVVNQPARAPLEISYRLVTRGFELRALDARSRAFTRNGAVVVKTHRQPERASAP